MLPLLKSSITAVAQRLGVFGALRRLQTHRTVVLTYHGVLSDGIETSPYLDGNFVTARSFERQLCYLKRHYAPLAMTEFVETCERNQPLPRRSVLITFDDGFANNHDLAFPLLRSHGFPFTVFLTTGMIGCPGAQLWTERVKRSVYLTERPATEVVLEGVRYRVQLDTPTARERTCKTLVTYMKRLSTTQRDRAVEAIETTFGPRPIDAGERERYEFLSWAQVRSMANAGVEFGSHTVTHPILSRLDEAELTLELTRSKTDIEQQTGRLCQAFAYPNGGPGDFGRREQRALQDAGYRCAFSLLGGLVGEPIDLFAVRRVNMGLGYSFTHFQAALAGLIGLPARIGHFGGRRDSGVPPATEEIASARQGTTRFTH